MQNSVIKTFFDFHLFQAMRKGLRKAAASLDNCDGTESDAEVDEREEEEPTSDGESEHEEEQILKTGEKRKLHLLSPPSASNSTETKPKAQMEEETMMGKKGKKSESASLAVEVQIKKGFAQEKRTIKFKSKSQQDADTIPASHNAKQYTANQGCEKLNTNGLGDHDDCLEESKSKYKKGTGQRTRKRLDHTTKGAKCHHHHNSRSTTTRQENILNHDHSHSLHFQESPNSTSGSTSNNNNNNQGQGFSSSSCKRERIKTTCTVSARMKQVVEQMISCSEEQYNAAVQQTTVFAFKSQQSEIITCFLEEMRRENGVLFQNKEAFMDFISDVYDHSQKLVLLHHGHSTR